MKEEKKIRIKSFLLALIYSVSLSCGLKSSNKTNESKKEYGEIFYGSIREVVTEYHNSKSNYLAYVIDERDLRDPNMEIYNSHMIKDRDTMLYILNELIAYEKENPSLWNRTIESMYKEWCIHNMCYNLGIQRTRTDSVDLNNADEEDYNQNNYLKLIIKEPHSRK